MRDRITIQFPVGDNALTATQRLEIIGIGMLLTCRHVVHCSPMIAQGYVHIIPIVLTGVYQILDILPTRCALTVYLSRIDLFRQDVTPCNTTVLTGRQDSIAIYNDTSPFPGRQHVLICIARIAIHVGIVCCIPILFSVIPAIITIL